MALVNIVYRLHCTESERGWGQRPWHLDFDSREEAEAKMEEINSQLGLCEKVPEIYDRADRIEMVEV